MAGIAIPPSLKPALSALARHHFWILAALAPVLLVPLLFVGTASLRARIATQRKQIEAKLGQARQVVGRQPHPNEEWSRALDAEAQAVDRETLDEWRRFWHSQRDFRVWPAELGEPFLADVARLKPGGKLERASLVRYQNMAPRLAQTLPARMGVEDEMVAADRGADPQMAMLPGAGGTSRSPVVAWSPESQRRLYESFVWPRPPVTTQVLLAQEEIWVYGLFCDLIAGFVKSSGAAGGHDSPLPLVKNLVVGFPASVASGPENREQQRIFMPKGGPTDAPGQEGVRMDVMPGAEGGGAGQAPWHPRFTSGGGRGMVGPEGPGAGPSAAGPSEDDYRGWVYVDFTGKPLSAAELAADDRKDMRMVHLMPFALEVVIDQRQLDRFLTTLAASAIPIDVRQVRVNPGAASGGAGRGALGAAVMPGELAGSMPGRPGTLRPNDLVVELRGSVALATPPGDSPAAPSEVSP